MLGQKPGNTRPEPEATCEHDCPHPKHLRTRRPKCSYLLPPLLPLPGLRPGRAPSRIDAAGASAAGVPTAMIALLRGVFSCRAPIDRASHTLGWSSGCAQVVVAAYVLFQKHLRRIGGRSRDPRWRLPPRRRRCPAVCSRGGAIRAIVELHYSDHCMSQAETLVDSRRPPRRQPNRKQQMEPDFVQCTSQNM